jgi:hypothetical protein
LQKVHECAQYSKHRLDMEKQTKCNLSNADQTPVTGLPHLNTNNHGPTF